MHLIAEAGRLAFADRERYVADPAFVPVPTRQLVSPAYIAERRKLISEDHSMGGRAPAAAGLHRARHQPHDHRRPGGNAVAFTTTIEAPFGAEIMVGGFMLNNQLTDFSPVPERDGKLLANRVEPGKRPRSLDGAYLRPRPRPQAGAVRRLGRRPAHHRRHAQR